MTEIKKILEFISRLYNEINYVLTIIHSKYNIYDIYIEQREYLESLLSDLNSVTNKLSTANDKEVENIKTYLKRIIPNFEKLHDDIVESELFQSEFLNNYKDELNNIVRQDYELW